MGIRGIENLQDRPEAPAEPLAFAVTEEGSLFLVPSETMASGFVSDEGNMFEGYIFFLANLSTEGI